MKNKTKKFCRKCNKEYPLTVKYCPKCSEPLSNVETETKKFCNKCNKEYPPNHNYCPDCGGQLSDNSGSDFKYPIVFNNKDKLLEFFSILLVEYEKIRPKLLGKLTNINANNSTINKLGEIQKGTKLKIKSKLYEVIDLRHEGDSNTKYAKEPIVNYIDIYLRRLKSKSLSYTHLLKYSPDTKEFHLFCHRPIKLSKKDIEL